MGNARRVAEEQDRIRERHREQSPRLAPVHLTAAERRAMGLDKDANAERLRLKRLITILVILGILVVLAIVGQTIFTLSR